MADPTTNTLRSANDATLTIRVIKSFTYRTVKPLVLHHLDLTSLTIGELKEMVRQEAKTKPAWKAYRTVTLDTLKLYTVAHGHKTTNLIVNLEDDEALFPQSDEQRLADWGLENETEISFFNMADYEAFVKDPEMKWM